MHLLRNSSKSSGKSVWLHVASLRDVLLLLRALHLLLIQSACLAPLFHTRHSPVVTVEQRHQRERVSVRYRRPKSKRPCVLDDVRQAVNQQRVCSPATGP